MEMDRQGLSADIGPSHNNRKTELQSSSENQTGPAPAHLADHCIHTLFEQQVRKTPHAVAAIDNDRRWTYQELNERSNQLARRLQYRGLKPGALVGVCLERSLESLVSVFGILKAGGAYLP